MKNIVEIEAQEKPLPKSLNMGQISYLLAQKWLFTPNDRTIEHNGQLVTLRKKNADVLMTLINFSNRTVTNEQLYQDVWQGKYVNEGVIKRSICDLRNTFNDDEKSLIVTIPKAGYRLSASVKKHIEAKDDSNINDLSHQQVKSEINQVNTTILEEACQKAPTEQPLQYRRFNNLLVMAVTMALTFIVCLSGFYYVQGEDVYDEVFKHDNPSFLINDLIDLSEDKNQIIEVLAGISQKLAAIEKKNPEYQNIAKQLMGAYLHVGLYKEAIDINRMLIRDSETLFGVDEKRTLDVRHLMVDTFMAAGQTQAAFDAAQHALEINLKYHLQNKALLATSYYQFSQVNLSCFYPHCDRVDAIEKGLNSINKTIELLSSADQLGSIAGADALLLKNWFIQDGDIKLSLVQQALAIYQEKLGKFDQRSAEALLQLGKIEAIWFNQYEQAIDHISQAIEIVSLLLGESHPYVFRIKRDLARTYLYAGQFDSTIEYIRQVERLSDHFFTCETTPCLYSLMLLGKAQLYGDDQLGAKMTAKIIENALQSTTSKM